MRPALPWRCDCVFEQEMEKGKESPVIELGVRHMLDPLTVVGSGVGTGVGPDSPDVRVMPGFQRSIALFG